MDLSFGLVEGGGGTAGDDDGFGAREGKMERGGLKQKRISARKNECVSPTNSGKSGGLKARQLIFVAYPSDSLTAARNQYRLAVRTALEPMGR